MKRVANKILKSKRVLVLASAMLIVSGSLFAQKSVSKWKLFTTNKAETEVVYSEPVSVAIVSYDNYLKTLDFVIESKVEVEDWMTDDSSWETSSTRTEIAQEEELVLEDWMLDFALLKEINESDLALEEWMNSTECWR